MAAVMAPMGLRPHEEKMFEGQPKGFPFEGFDIEDVMLPENDDMGIPSEDDDDLEDELEVESGFGSVIVVDNLPKVPKEKQEKLTAVIRKVFGQVGTIREGGLDMPTDGEGATQGYAFIEYLAPQEAAAARDQLHGYKLDKNHTFAVNLFDDFDKYDKVPGEYLPPEPKDFKPQENLQDYMLDSRGRDQFVIRYGDEAEIFWNDAQKRLCEEVYKRSFWTESFVQWSPRGNFMATVHRQGVAVWGGPSFQRLERFSHPGVLLIDFSPCETYLLSYSSIDPSNPREKATIVINVFNLRTGKKLRSFQGSTDDFAVGAAAGPEGSIKWPVFKWAGGAEDAYFARLSKNAIAIYECPDMVLLDKKSLKLDGVQDFAWSPAEPILCAYQTEQAGGNLPARVSLIRLPERTELRQKNLFSVSDVKMYWHPQGDYLAVKVDRFTKTRKSTFTGFELFSVKDRDIPMEVLELPNKAEKIIDFAWEPKGNRFAILHGDGPKPTFSVYAMKDMKSAARGVVLIGSQPGKAANGIHWSPQGKTLVLSGLKSLNGQLEFFNVDDFEVMDAAEHFMCTDIEWDPTGRYVATAVTSVHQMENGFNVWQFNGALLYRTLRDRFFQFSWRPRHPSLLTRDQEAAILKDLKMYSKKYDEVDAAIETQADTDLVAERQRMMADWQSWYSSKASWLQDFRAQRQELFGDRYQEGEYTLEKVDLEETVDVREEVLK